MLQALHKQALTQSLHTTIPHYKQGTKQQITNTSQQKRMQSNTLSTYAFCSPQQLNKEQVTIAPGSHTTQNTLRTEWWHISSPNYSTHIHNTKRPLTYCALAAVYTLLTKSSEKASISASR